MRREIVGGRVASRDGWGVGVGRAGERESGYKSMICCRIGPSTSVGSQPSCVRHDRAADQTQARRRPPRNPSCVWDVDPPPVLSPARGRTPPEPRVADGLEKAHLARGERWVTGGIAGGVVRMHNLAGELTSVA